MSNVTPSLETWTLIWNTPEQTGLNYLVCTLVGRARPLSALARAQLEMKMRHHYDHIKAQVFVDIKSATGLFAIFDRKMLARQTRHDYHHRFDYSFAELLSRFANNWTILLVSGLLEQD